MERKPNVAAHHEQDITINRNQAENRAMWLALIFEELKRCADEFAYTDASMQTIRSMILEE